MALDLQNVSAVEDVREVTLLGRLCWYTVHDREVSVDELVAKYTAARLPSEFLPKPVRPVDAFRRATTEVEVTRIPQGQYFVNILVREVRADAKSVTRHLVKEIVDSANVRLYYEPAGEVIFDRNTDKLHAKAFIDDDKTVRKQLGKAAELYEKYRASYDGSHIRRMIRDILAGLNPVAVRPSGGVYFVPEKNAETLEKLRELIQSLGSEFFTIPLIDNAQARDMVYQKYVDQVTAQLSEIAKILRKEDKTTGELKLMFESSKNILKQIEEDEGILEENLFDLKERARLLKLQLMELLENQN